MNKLLSYLQAHPVVTLLAMVVLAVMLYGGTLNHEFVLDDGLVIEQNTFVQEGIKGIPQIFSHSHTYGATSIEDNGYRPLPLTVFAVLKSLAGDGAGAFHFFNVFLYGLATGFFLLWLWKLRDRIPAGLSVLVAALFLMHPVHTESVANVKGMEDVLLLLWLSLLLLSIHRFAENHKPADLGFGLLVFFFALITKETSVSFLALVPAYLYVVKPVKLSRLLQASVAFCIVFIAVWALRSVVLSDASTVEPSTLNNALVAIESPADQWATALWMQLKYLQLFLFPIELSSDYSFDQIPAVAMFDWQGLLAVASMLGLAALTAYGIWKKALWGFGLLVFAATMSIVSNTVFLIGATMAERFLFIPSAGLCLALVLGIHNLLPRGKKAWLTYAMIPVLLLFSIKTISRNRDWETNKTLTEVDAKTAQNSSRMQATLAKLRFNEAKANPNPQLRQQQLAKAKDLFERSVQILPSNFDAWYNLGLVEEQLGNRKAALEAYAKCLDYAPEFALAYNNVGVLLFNAGEQKEAAANFLKAYEYGSTNADIVSNRGLVEHVNGNYSEAIRYYEESLEINPAQQNSIGNLVKTHRKLGNEERAKYYEQRLNAVRGRY